MSFIPQVCSFAVILGINLVALRALDSTDICLISNRAQLLCGGFNLLGCVFVEKSRLCKGVKLARKVPLSLLLTDLLALVGFSALGFRLGKNCTLGGA